MIDVQIVERHGDLVTFKLRYPLVIHAELMTHRVFSRNAQSNRAMPAGKLRKEVENNPYIPDVWLANQSGMQPSNDVIKSPDAATFEWNRAKAVALDAHAKLERYGVHKQWTNRMLMPYQHITVLVTATDWDNFFGLRCAPDAQHEIQQLACAMRDEMDKTNGVIIGINDTWHLPFITYDDLENNDDYNTLALISAARCARVSYNNLDGTKPNMDKDLGLAIKLAEAGHMSPFEHQARCSENKDDFNIIRDGKRYSNNFASPWVQFRSEVNG